MGRHRSGSRSSRSKKAPKATKRRGVEAVDVKALIDSTLAPVFQKQEAAESMALTVSRGGLVPMHTMGSERMRMARESRRIHVTGFPQTAVKDDMEGLFRQWIDRLRRRMVEEETGTTLGDFENDVDRILEVYMDTSKINPYAFVELNTGDMAEVLIREGDGVMELSCGGRAATLKLRRPRDFRSLTRVDELRVIVQGLPSSFTEERVAEGLGIGGAVTNVQLKGHYGYGEFESVEAARQAIAFFNGLVMKRKLIVAQPMTDVLRAMCIVQGMNITTSLSDDAEVNPTDDLLAEILSMSFPLATSLGKLSSIHPHLSPMFGATLPVIATPIVVLLGIIDESDVASDDAYSALCADLQVEAERFGRVKDLIVPRYTPRPEPPEPPSSRKRPRDGAPRVPMLPLTNPFEAQAAPAVDAEAEERAREEMRYETQKADFVAAAREWDDRQSHRVYGAIGRVFVVYESVDEAAEAQRSLTGRLFRGRTVVTSFLFEDILYPPDHGAAEGAKPAGYLK